MGKRSSTKTPNIQFYVCALESAHIFTQKSTFAAIITSEKPSAKLKIAIWQQQRAKTTSKMNIRKHCINWSSSFQIYIDFSPSRLLFIFILIYIIISRKHLNSNSNHDEGNEKRENCVCAVCVVCTSFEDST